MKQAAKILGITEGAVKNAALGHRIAFEKRAVSRIDQTRHILFFTGAALAAYDTKRREPRKGFFRGAKVNQDLMRLRRVVALEVQR